MNRLRITLLFAVVLAHTIVSKSDEGFDTDFSHTPPAIQKSSRNIILMIHDSNSFEVAGSAVFFRYADESRETGYFLTAFHVIKHCRLKRVCGGVKGAFNGVYGLFGSKKQIIPNGRDRMGTFEGLQLVAVDEDSDLAIFKAEIPGKMNLEELTFGSSTKEGDKVYVIGHPLPDLIKYRESQRSWTGYRKAFSKGKVTAAYKLVRLPESMGGYIRRVLISNADTLPGNSGGGVFNEKGELIGITLAVYKNNVAKYSLSEDSSEHGSDAAPVQTIQKLLESIGL